MNQISPSKRSSCRRLNTSLHKEFTIDLISNASMGIFTNNTMAQFRNQLAQPLQLGGDWQVALASISFPSNINNVNSAEIVAYVSSGAELDASHWTTSKNSKRYIQQFRRASVRCCRSVQKMIKQKKTRKGLERQGIRV